jgi:hypothetical protein
MERAFDRLLDYSIQKFTIIKINPKYHYVGYLGYHGRLTELLAKMGSREAIWLGGLIV